MVESWKKSSCKLIIDTKAQFETEKMLFFKVSEKSVNFVWGQEILRTLQYLIVIILYLYLMTVKSLAVLVVIKFIG